MTTVRLIGPGRAGRSLAAALADAGCDVRGVLTRHDDVADAGPGRRRPRDRHPRRGHRRGGRPGRPVPEHRGRPPVGGARPRRAGPPSPPGVAAPARAPALARGGPGPAAQRDHLRRGRRPGGRGAGPAARRRRSWSSTTSTAPPTTPRPASPPTTWWRSWARSSGWRPRPGSTSTPSWAWPAAALTDVAELGPAAALTGPAARGDEATLDRHRRTLDPAEVPGYDAGVALARRLAARRAPTDGHRAVAATTRRGHAPTAVAPRRVAGPGGRRRRCAVGDLGAGSSPTRSTPSAPSGAASGSSPPWGRCTPGTARSSSGPRRSATSWR